MHKKKPAMVIFWVRHRYTTNIFGQIFKQGRISRAYIPSMDFISFSAIWLFVKLVFNSRSKYLTYFNVFVLYGAHVFRQSRGAIITLAVITIALLFFRRKYGLILAGGILVLLSSIILVSIMDSNLLTNPFLSAREDILESKGTWEKRLRRIKTDIDEFKEHYLIGGGAGVLRVHQDDSADITSEKSDYLLNLSYQHDLGYTHWLKNFGILGIFILLFYFISLLFMGSQSLKLLSGSDSKILIYFSLSYLFFILISFITLNHFAVPKHSIFNSLNAAIIVRSYHNLRQIDQD